MGCRAEKFPLVFVINPSPGAGGSPGLQGSRRREGSTAIGFALGSIRQTEILGLHGCYAFSVQERSIKQDTIDIGFRKQKCRYSEKHNDAWPFVPFAPVGQGRVLSESHSSESFCSGQLEFLPRLQRRAGQRRKLDSGLRRTWSSSRRSLQLRSRSSGEGPDRLLWRGIAATRMGIEAIRATHAPNGSIVARPNRSRCHQTAR
jgi:hypothetical protein